ncbi:hypothetical protein EFA69_16260 [Rufibacter immobilis]|uniref:Uncharacterized protein n=1 Tax=Rufibacter immobilis TaxID=1348778 RepID=A0A3M9MQ98_9BACT|nr:hypothetical protein [Rufibacter immobilis]RNI27671.1 hypothetical protein EFA69_16260 [Rufibacter immobilis]
MSAEVENLATEPSKGKKVLNTVTKVLKFIAKLGGAVFLLKATGKVKISPGLEKAAEIAGVAADVAEAVKDVANE